MPTIPDRYELRSDLICVKISQGAPGEIRDGYYVAYNQLELGSNIHVFYLTASEEDAKVLSNLDHGWYGGKGFYGPCTLICDGEGRWGLHKTYPNHDTLDPEDLTSLREARSVQVAEEMARQKALDKLSKEERVLLGLS